MVSSEKSSSQNSGMTIEELSFRSEVTTRNIRAYQSKGLLPAPQSIDGHRAVYYSTEHLARLRVISRLQARGYSLAGIAELLSALADGQTLEQILGVETAIEETRRSKAVTLTEEEFRAGMPADLDFEQTVTLLRELGLLVRDGSSFRLTDPDLLEFGMMARSAGIPLEELLDAQQNAESKIREIAAQFVGIFLQHIHEPFEAVGMPPEKLDEHIQLMQLMREKSGLMIQALMETAMDDAIEAASEARTPDSPS